MANQPIKASDLYKDDGAILNGIAQLKALVKEYESALTVIGKDAIKLQVKLKKLNVTTSDQREQVEQVTKEADRLSKAHDRYKQSLTSVNKQMIALQEQTKKNNRITRIQTKLANAAEGSYDQLSAQYSLNKARLNAMTKAQREAAESSEGLVTKTKDIYEEMKRLQAETGKTALNVGNYKSDIKDAISETIGFNRALNLLRANPIVAFVSLLVGGVTALFSAFTKTERGAQVMARATGILQGLFSEFVGLVDNLATSLIDAFNNPKEAIKELWEAIKDNLVDRFNGLIDLFKAVGTIIKSGFTKGFKEAKIATIQLATGLDELEQNEVAENFKETTKRVIETADAMGQLRVNQRLAAEAARKLTIQIGELATQEELLNAVADDTTKSFEERRKAAEEAGQVQIKRSELELNLARKQLGFIKDEIALRAKNKQDYTAQSEELVNATQRVQDAERNYLLSQKENSKRKAEIDQDELERNLDILIDGFDNQKTINERLVKDDRKTFAQRRKILSDTVRLADDSFNKQIETIQQRSKEQINANDLINESDAVVLNQKIRSLGLSEALEGRLLEIIRERRLAVLDLAEAQQELNEKELASIKAAAEKAKLKQQINLNNALERFSQEQELERAEFELSKKTDVEKKVFSLQQEQERLTKILKLNKMFSGELSDLQIKTLKAQLQKVDQELDVLAKPGQSLFDKLGFTVSDEQKQGLQSSFQFAKQQVLDYINVQKQLTDRLVQDADRRVQSAQSALQAELQAAQAGYASRVEQARKDLDLAKASQTQALRQQQRAERQQRQIQTIQQASNLATAAAQLWVKPGWPLALPLTAIMFGSFAASKIRAASLAKRQFGDGGLEFLDFGGSHVSGNDIPIGMTKDGKQRTAERGEAMAIINKPSTAKYRSLLPEIINSLNAGTFERMFQSGNRVSNNTTNVNVDTSRMERSLENIEAYNSRSYSVDSNGQRVERYKNRTRTYAA